MPPAPEAALDPVAAGDLGGRAHSASSSCASAPPPLPPPLPSPLPLPFRRSRRRSPSSSVGVVVGRRSASSRSGCGLGRPVVRLGGRRLRSGSSSVCWSRPARSSHSLLDEARTGGRSCPASASRTSASTSSGSASIRIARPASSFGVVCVEDVLAGARAAVVEPRARRRRAAFWSSAAVRRRDRASPSSSAPQPAAARHGRRARAAGYAPASAHCPL